MQRREENRTEGKQQPKKKRMWLETGVEDTVEVPARDSKETRMKLKPGTNQEEEGDDRWGGKAERRQE